ncbi:MAG: carboxy terminal-processing peptidase [Desulfobacteraceae bacterium]|nr:carboxy terminal-processing peptidase [Desulfobacteraceae bacterium]
MKFSKVFLSACLTVFLSFNVSFAYGSPSGNALAVSTYYKPLSPEKIQVSTSINILKNLERNHFRTLDIDDSFSSQLLTKYLEDLDSTRVYFLASDIKEFDAYKFQLDKALKKGDLRPAFDIFNRYEQRMIERLIFMIKQLDCCYGKLDLNTNESLDPERKKAPWASSVSELDDIWRKRLKNDILNLKLSEKPESNIKDVLEKRYKNQLVRTGQLTSEDAFRVYMNSFTSMYDPHTQYFSPRASEDFNIRMSLSLEGIGALLQTENEYTKVLSLVTAGPADKSNLLKAGDRIIGVGQGTSGEIVDVIGWRLDDVVQLIRGPKGTVVQLKIIPSSATDDHQTKVIKITRNTVKLEDQAAKKRVITLKYKDRSYKVGVISIPTFYLDFNAFQSGAPNYKSTTRDVHKLLNELKAEKVDGIIVDLRDNGGGALPEATSLTGLFIKTGPTVQVRSSKNKISTYPDDDPEIAYSGPLAVLVNRMSASASEIFAGAIRDLKRGIIIGSQTFGKGTVQSLIDLNKGQLKITVAKFYRISGESTQHKGIIPDVIFPSIYNPDDIGESSLPEAMPWDKINPVKYKPYMNIDLEPIIAKLKVLHDRRVKNSPDFKYLIEYSNHFKALQKKTMISLNEKKRVAEMEESHKWALNLENTLRIAKGKKPYKNYDELKKDKEKESEDEANKKNDNNNDNNDTILNEGVRVLIDYIKLLH